MEQKRGGVGLGIGGHHRPHRGENDEWLTPPSIIEALGPFDLDPCAPVTRPWDTARRHLTIDDDGLGSTWRDDEFVWCNPPYGPQTWQWLDRLHQHPAGGIALIFARTETEGFHAQVWMKAASIIFIKGRLFFHRVDGERASHNSGAPSCLVAYGELAAERLSCAHANGSIVGPLVADWRAV